jgi:HK97 family phage major capsid protein
MSTFAQRIQATQQGLAAKHDRLAQLSGADDSEPAEVDTLAKDIERDETTLASLQRAEAVMARQSVALSGTALIPTPPQNGEQGSSGERRVFAQAKKNLSRRESSDLLIRGLACRVVAKVTGQRPDEVLAERYPDNHQVREVLNYVQRAASAPATTTTTGWAAELVSEAVLDFLDNLVPDSIYPRLRDMGARFTFGRNGIVTLPSRAATPTIAGSFVAQGGAIPVRQAAFNAVSLTPKKMAVISTFTREIAEHSTPNIEALIRQIITEDTSISIDSVLLDATAASTTRPAGLRNGVTVTTASAEAVALDALVEDAKTLLGVLIGANALRMPVWIMNPAQELAIGLISNANGEFPFAGQLEAGRFLRYPILTSTTVTAGQLILVDAADFFSATGDEPRFDVNDSATLHMEDTTPLALSAAGSPNTVAAPIRSLWQTDTIGIRMIMELNWAMRRSGVIAWTETVVW